MMGVNGALYLWWHSDWSSGLGFFFSFFFFFCEGWEFTGSGFAFSFYSTFFLPSFIPLIEFGLSTFFMCNRYHLLFVPYYFLSLLPTNQCNALIQYTSLFCRWAG